MITPSNRAHITYTGIDQKFDWQNPKSSILECSIHHQIPHMHECGGHGQCTTCRIRIIDGHSNVSSRTKREQETARKRKWDPSIRLACQCRIHGDVSIQRLVWNSSEINNLQLETVPDGSAEERAIAILFCDIRGFTKIASENSTFDIAHVLNRFYTVLGDPILKNNGIIYQYVGDEIIGLFGVANANSEKNSKDAIRAALGMQYAIELLNHSELVDFDIKIKMGIGINFGKAYIGNLGHPKHKQFAVVGDPINTASRIQSFNKEVGTSILISESVVQTMSIHALDIGQEFNPQIRGHDHETKLFELKGFKEMDVQLELQRSLDHLLRNEEEFAHEFYSRVFQKAPEVRALFKNNMVSQGRLLTHMLGGIVYSMSRPEHLSMGLKLLGESHARYGVREAHYPIVVSALLETIRDVLGDQYTERIMEAWEKAIELITSEMKKYTQ